MVSRFQGSLYVSFLVFRLFGLISISIASLMICFVLSSILAMTLVLMKSISCDVFLTSSVKKDVDSIFLTAL